jgi:hypothetical protein
VTDRCWCNPKTTFDVCHGVAVGQKVSHKLDCFLFSLLFCCNSHCTKEAVEKCITIKIVTVQLHELVWMMFVHSN